MISYLYLPYSSYLPRFFACSVTYISSTPDYADQSCLPCPNIPFEQLPCEQQHLIPDEYPTSSLGLAPPHSDWHPTESQQPGGSRFHSGQTTSGPHRCVPSNPGHCQQTTSNLVPPHHFSLFDFFFIYYYYYYYFRISPNILQILSWIGSDSLLLSSYLSLSFLFSLPPPLFLLTTISSASSPFDIPSYSYSFSLSPSISSSSLHHNVRQIHPRG